MSGLFTIAGIFWYVKLYYLKKASLGQYSKWVTAEAAPHVGNVGDSGSLPGRENAVTKKVPGPQRGIRGGAAFNPCTEDAPDPQEDVDPLLLPRLI